MRPAALLLVPAVAIACGGPAQAPTAPLPPVVIATTTPEAAPVPTPHEIAAELPPAEPPVVPLQRFAALVPGERADLYDVGSRLILRAGNRLFSLSPGQMRRERDLERALSDHGELRFGAIGGEYPDALVADQLIPARGENALPRRRYVRVRRGGVTEIARAPDDAWAGQASQASEMVSLPGGRIVAVLPSTAASGRCGARLRRGREGRDRGDPRSARPALVGFLHAQPGRITHDGRARARRDIGSLADVGEGRAPTDPHHRYPSGRGAPGGAAADHAGQGCAPDGKGPVRRGRGRMEARGDRRGSHAGVAAPGRRRADGDDGWPCRTRRAGSDDARASWPSVTVEGRKVRARFASARSTPAVGFWAIAADGLGLFHDRAPGRLVDVAAPDAGASNGPRLE